MSYETTDEITLKKWNSLYGHLWSVSLLQYWLKAILASYFFLGVQSHSRRNSCYSRRCHRFSGLYADPWCMKLWQHVHFDWFALKKLKSSIVSYFSNGFRCIINKQFGQFSEWQVERSALAVTIHNIQSWTLITVMVLKKLFTAGCWKQEVPAMVNEVKNIYQPIIQEQQSSTLNLLTLKHKKRSKKTKLKYYITCLLQSVVNW